MAEHLHTAQATLYVYVNLLSRFSLRISGELDIEQDGVDSAELSWLNLKSKTAINARYSMRIAPSRPYKDANDSIMLVVVSVIAVEVILY
jgi:hypothetical protein